MKPRYIKIIISERRRNELIPRSVIREIDKTIKDIWYRNIRQDYNDDNFQKEATLQCCLYYHLRRRLKKIFEENNLKLYAEYHFANLNYRADLAIVHQKTSCPVAVFELKYKDGYSKNKTEAIKHDIWKLRDYIQYQDTPCQYYLAIIYETEHCPSHFLHKKSAESWADGCVTELIASRENGETWFDIYAYNNMNMQYSE